MKKIILMLMILAAGFGFRAQAESVPQFPGGDEVLQKYLADKIQYPPQAAEMGIEGVVGVVFIVHADGTLSEPKISRMVDPDLEAEAIRVVMMMPNWIPAENNGKPVDAAVNLPIKFSLPSAEAEEE